MTREDRETDRREGNRQGEEMRRVAARAVRRLRALEIVLLLVIVALAVAAGALAAWILGESFGFPFRLSWLVSSLFLVTIPALAALLRERKSQGADD